MTKVYIYKDEKYPCYYIDEEDIIGEVLINLSDSEILEFQIAEKTYQEYQRKLHSLYKGKTNG